MQTGQFTLSKDGRYMRKERWTIDHIPQQGERIAIVTGANSGLGYITTRALALKGAKVIMACRNLEKGEMARLNILGHFVLTARLWPLLSKTDGSRVVQVSSLAHYWGKIRFEDIHWEKGYKKWSAYGMSKLANLLFVRELATRLAGAGRAVTAAAAHPGYAATANDVNQGAFFGPGGFKRIRGWPVLDSPSQKLVTDEVAGKLWDVSESLTGKEFRV